ncbi:hypothetical protein DCE79_07665 [Lysinibacillus sp. 2017]|nr:MULTISPECIES: hypothetical protein [unclassified Lysinibacillus]AWE09257.1 hypothetical protein DCE79_07665 [Lysinibacillus sp. 2017]TGN33345.1 hypothetical protein E4L99_14770 [Lysinibacillus sp. S2017]
MINTFGNAIWFTIIPVVFYISCFYFTLTFFQHLKSGDTQLQKSSKLFAVLSLALALLAPTIINYFIILKMSSF